MEKNLGTSIQDPENRGKLIESSGDTNPDSIRLLLHTEAGERVCLVSKAAFESSGAKAGDWVEIAGGIRVLTAARSRTSHWFKHVSDPKRRRGVAARTVVETAIRDYFISEKFIETRTPLLVPSPGMEPHIRPMAVSAWATEAETGTREKAFLPTSPEFAMKRLLAGGLEKIFQICPAFRDEPRSSTHHAEFTMLEWYRAFATIEEIMRDVERMFARIAGAFADAGLATTAHGFNWAPPWPRLTTRELFQKHLRVDIAHASRDELAAICAREGLSAGPALGWDDLYFVLWLNRVEPALPSGRPVFVTEYPASQAALSVVETQPDGTRWARRFEVYAGGYELGNAFQELTDPVEQRRRFEDDMRFRTQVYGKAFPPSPIDEGFLQALEEGMPPSAGIAMGVDRIIMLFSGETDIEFTHWLPSHWGTRA